MTTDDAPLFAPGADGVALLLRWIEKNGASLSVATDPISGPRVVIDGHDNPPSVVLELVDSNQPFLIAAYMGVVRPPRGVKSSPAHKPRYCPACRLLWLSARKAACPACRSKASTHRSVAIPWTGANQHGRPPSPRGAA